MQGAAGGGSGGPHAGSGGPHAGSPGGSPSDGVAGAGSDGAPTGRTPQLFRCESGNTTVSPPRIVRLHGAQYAKAVAALLGGRSRDANRDRPGYTGSVPFQLANTADRFTTRAASYSVGEAEVPSVVETAEAVGLEVAQALAEPGASCLSEDTAFASCMASLVASKGAILFARPLDAEEIEAYVSAAIELEEAVGAVRAAATSFEAMLRAPQFLFRTELGQMDGAGQLALTPFEVASALSYTLTDGPPDQPLWEAAEQGLLSDPAEIARQVERLLTPLEDNAALARFLREYVRYDRAETVAKDPDIWAFHDPELLQDDTRRFIGDVLARHGRQAFLASLLTTDSGIVRAATQASYGLNDVDEAPTRITFPAGERAGILTQPSWLAGHSQTDANDPIRRGLFIRESLLCGEVPPLPVEDIEPLEERDDVPLREVLREHRENASCAGCHSLMDPLGLAFEQFDHLGRFRTMEGPFPVDATGHLDGAGDQDGAYDGPAELAQRLAASATVRRCFVMHAYEFWRGEHRHEAPGCALEAADAAYTQSGGDLVAMLTSFFTSDAFLLRDTEAP